MLSFTKPLTMANLFPTIHLIPLTWQPCEDTQAPSSQQSISCLEGRSRQSNIYAHQSHDLTPGSGPEAEVGGQE